MPKEHRCKGSGHRSCLLEKSWFCSTRYHRVAVVVDVAVVDAVASDWAVSVVVTDIRRVALAVAVSAV